MKRVVVRYNVKSGRLEEHEDLIRKVRDYRYVPYIALEAEIENA